MTENTPKFNQSAEDDVTAGMKHTFNRMLMRDVRLIDDKKLSPLDKLVGIYLSDMCMYGRDHSWPSYKSIASECGCSVRAAKSSVQMLKEFEYIRAEHRFNNGEQSSNLYFPAWQVVKTLHSDDEKVAPTPVPNLHSGDAKVAPKTPDGDPLVETSNLKHTPAARAPESTGHVLNSSPASQPQAGNDNWPTDAFDQFWSIFPDKTGKAYARKCLQKIEDRGDVKFQTVIDGVHRYIKNKPKDRAWCHPSTFINQERWDDEPPTNDGYETLHQKARALTKVAI